jgi:hypothetical protein
MPHSLSLTAVLAGVLVLGCDDQPSPAEPASRQTSPATEQNFDAAGAEVIRFQFGGFPIVDTDRGYVLGAGTVSLINEVPECDGTPAMVDGNPRGEVVITPSDQLHQVLRVRQGTLILYGRVPEDLCTLGPEDVIARGRGNATATLLARAPSVLIGIHVTGTMELTSGGLAHILVDAQYHVYPDGSFALHVDHFELKPIGG